MPQSDNAFLLAPAPRRLTPASGSFSLTHGGMIAIQGDPAEILPALQALERDLGPAWTPCVVPADTDAAIALTILPAGALPAQGYRLCIDRRRIVLTAADRAGLFYGIMTLRQLARGRAGHWPACMIEDAPDFPTRGVMLDISRDKVPTLDTLFALVDRLAEWKLNRLELYTEHTFAYRQHPEVWAAASPMTAGDIRTLDAYCQSRCVELVPNQNSFGHMDRWLKHPRYNDLAECPQGGFTMPWGGVHTQPFSLNPGDPRNLELLRELYDELLPNFTSRQFNVGCDETWDLGHGRSKDAVAARGRGRVYLEFLLKIHDLVRVHGRTMEFWGDIILQHPELVPELPRDAIALEWGYDANHSFAEHGARFSAAGIPFFVCPGTSSWNSVAGRTTNALGNLRNAAENGLKHGAIGYLNTDWGDGGHWQPLPVSELGYLYGAAVSWNTSANSDLPIAAALNRHAFHDPTGTLGEVAAGLGDVYRLSGQESGNSTVLFQLLQQPPGWALPAGVTTETLGRTRDAIDALAARLPHSRARRSDAALLRAEFAHAAALLRHACNRGLAARAGTLADPATCAALAADWRPRLRDHTRIWLARNRPGGLRDSLARMQTLLKTYGG